MRSGFDVLDEFRDLVSELPLLLIGGAWPGIEGDFGDDVLFAEAAGVDASNGEGVAGFQLDQNDVDQLYRLIQLLGVGARSIHQQINAAVLRAGVLVASREQGGRQGRDGE